MVSVCIVCGTPRGGYSILLSLCHAVCSASDLAGTGETLSQDPACSVPKREVRIFARAGLLGDVTKEMSGQHSSVCSEKRSCILVPRFA